LVGAVFALALLFTPAPRGAQAGSPFASEISLPNGWQPEGIATGDGPVIYAGSLANGAIYAANLKTGAGAVLVPGQAGRVTVGLYFDERTKYIYAAGGPTGKAYVFDSRSGATVAEFRLTSGASFINDVIVTEDAAYFTNSSAPEFYRIPLSRGGRIAAGTVPTTIALGSGFDFIPNAFNANGIESVKDGKYLIIVNSTSGKLYRVNPRTGAAQAIDLGGASVSYGDGLRLRDDTLYVVRNQLNQVAAFRLGDTYLSGTLQKTISDPRFDVPTTLASFGNSLYAVNARFSTPATPSTTYTIVRFKP
jgi:sugar lactone lactonase YvrE